MSWSSIISSFDKTPELPGSGTRSGVLFDLLPGIEKMRWKEFKLLGVVSDAKGLEDAKAA